MNNFERVKDLVNKYVQEHGNKNEMTRGDFLAWVHETYENISAAKNNLYPTDISYNLYNAGLKDFPGPNLCLVYVEERETFRLVGTDYNHTGPIWQYKGKSNEQVVGQWVDGVCKMGDGVKKDDVPENIRVRREDLAAGVKYLLKAVPVTVNESGRNVTVHFQEILICGSRVEDEGYRIYNASSEWSDTTTYLCEEAEDGTWFYYLESIDECIGEMQRLVMFEAQKGKKQPSTNESHASELSQIVTADVFEKSYRYFIENADQYTEQGTTKGSSQVPYGFSSKPECDGAHFSAHFGQGGVSATPYMNWWVVSIYYLPSSGNIVMGIEETRYPHLKKMEIRPLRYSQVGNKKINMAVYYSATKDTVDYKKLYDKFIQVCEEVMRLGLD